MDFQQVYLGKGDEPGQSGRTEKLKKLNIEYMVKQKYPGVDIY